MVKIKVKKEMNLPELIQWGWENGIKNETFLASRGGRIYFDEDSWIGMNESILVEPKETFEVEIEEEIDENTKIPVLVEVAKLNEDSEDILIYYYRGISISEATNNIIASKSFYMLNDDYTMTLLWKNGEMVE